MCHIFVGLGALAASLTLAGPIRAMNFWDLVYREIHPWDDPPFRPALAGARVAPRWSMTAGLRRARRSITWRLCDSDRKGSFAISAMCGVATI